VKQEGFLPCSQLRTIRPCTDLCGHSPCSDIPFLKDLFWYYPDSGFIRMHSIKSETWKIFLVFFPHNFNPQHYCLLLSVAYICNFIIKVKWNLQSHYINRFNACGFSIMGLYKQKNDCTLLNSAWISLSTVTTSVISLRLKNEIVDRK
jgi:hypothetical protein